MLIFLFQPQPTTTDFWSKIIPIIPSVLWFILLVVVLVKLWRDEELRKMLKNVTGVKGFGIELRFDEVQKSMSDAIAQGEKKSSLDIPEKDKKWNIHVPEAARESALSRLRHHAALFQNAHILWIDDNPKNNKNEIALLRELTAHVECVKTTEAALERLRDDDYDIVLSDMSRDGEKSAGLDFLARYKKQAELRSPVILYVGHLSRELGVPGGAFGITNRPDELVHLILDVLERTKLN